MRGASLIRLLAALVSCACERDGPPIEPPERPAPRAPASDTPPPLPAESPAPRPAPSAVVALERELQATRLGVPPLRTHAPRLAFGRGVFGQLTDSALRVFELSTFELVATVPLVGPRALVTLADGALLAIGSSSALRFEPANRRAKPVVRLPLLSNDIYADAQQPDRIWTFDGLGSSALGPPKLVSFRLVTGDAHVQLPEQTIELAAPRGGVFGPTREGVWLYLTPQRGERLSPGGAKLPGLTLPDITPPTWVLPARRLDQSWWIAEDGTVSLAVVAPPFKRLRATAKLGGTPFSAAVAAGGELLAVTAVTGPGPRFELVLLDAQLALVARRDLASEAPSGQDDWLKAVTTNQEVAASANKPLVAVGGTTRLAIYGGKGELLFSIPSR